MRKRSIVVAGLVLWAATGCGEGDQAVVYQAIPVVQRDIVVSAQASGTVQPDTIVEVKSKASGEILNILVETGQEVERGALLVEVDQRVPRNNLAQAQADLEVARARLANAQSKKRRADELFKTQSITQEEQEQAALDEASARADVVRSQVAIENARDQLSDTRVTAPIAGMIITKTVERGSVISSPTSSVGEGTILLTMADLNLVQVRTLVDETDIGKIQPGMEATVVVDAYPNRPFQGEVLKIEPMAEVQQNVTMFPVLVRIANRDKLLKPGMNAEVEIHIGNREGVLAVTNAALRTDRDVASAAEVLGLNPDDVQEQLARAAERPAGASDSNGSASLGGTAATPGGDSTAAGEKFTLPNGTVVPLPAGVTSAQIGAIMQKRRSGEQPTAEERALLQKVFAGMRGGAGRRPGGAQQSSTTGLFGGSYIVFVKRGDTPVPVRVETGLTDLDYSEVVSGLAAGDSVMVLPSAGLVQSQQEMQERLQRMNGGGVPGMRQAR
jgi:HlyD family secretion protein